MLTTTYDIVLLCIRKITPIIVRGADTNETSKSAVQSASSKGFFTRAVDCEHNEISNVELPHIPLNTTIPYNIINVSNDNELMNSLFASYSKMSLSNDDDAFSCVVDFVIIVTFRVAFFNCESFSSHCLSSILRALPLKECSMGGTPGSKNKKINKMKMLKHFLCLLLVAVIQDIIALCFPFNIKYVLC